MIRLKNQKGACQILLEWWIANFFMHNLSTGFSSWFLTVHEDNSLIFHMFEFGRRMRGWHLDADLSNRTIVQALCSSAYLTTLTPPSHMTSWKILQGPEM